MGESAHFFFKAGVFLLFVSRYSENKLYICTDLIIFGLWTLRETSCNSCIIIRYPAVMIFYEQNNLYAFKQIFIQQYEFAVSEYF